MKDRKEIWFPVEKFDFRNKDLKLRMKETSRTRKSREAHTVFVVVEQDRSFPHLPELTHLIIPSFSLIFCVASTGTSVEALSVKVQYSFLLLLTVV